MTKFFTKFCLPASCLLLAATAFAQVQLEFGFNSYPSAPTGPSASNQTVQFLERSSGTTFVSYTPTIAVTAAWSDQQYTNVAGMPAGKTFGSTFGSELGASSKTASGTVVFANLGSKSAPASSLFTASPFGTPGTGIDTANNYGFNCFTTAEPMYAAGAATNGRYYFSTLTLTFNRPVANPVLHFIGLGGTQGSEGFSTELELQTSGVTLDRLSGTGVFNIVANKVLNSASSITAVSGTPASTTGAASGSVRATGNNITTLVFKVYLRGDGGGSAWSSAKEWTGDRWLLGISMSEPVITGNVYDDANGLLGTPVNTVDGTGTNAGGLLFANLIDASGNVVLSSAVASDGAYIMQDIQAASFPDNYSIVLSTTKGTAGSAAPAAALPAGWVNTGEFFGTGAGNDGNVNGVLPNISVANSASTVANANFGIDRLPNSDPKLQSFPSNTPNTFYSLTGLTGTDAEDGAMGTGQTFIITTLPAGASLYYNLTAVYPNEVIPNFDPSLLVIDPLDAILTTSFTYASIDAAGEQDPTPATFAVNWSVTLPVTLQNFTATKTGTMVLLQWNTAQEIDSHLIIIERSTDGISFTGIGQLNAAGNSSTVTNYSFTDNQPAAGNNYYRLKLVSNEGSQQYSPVKLLFDGVATISAYPNPVQTQLKISIAGSHVNQPLDIQVYSQAGQLVLSKQFSNTLQTETVDLHSLSDGMYVLSITQPDGSQVAAKNIMVRK